jgi:hypothetical protein
MDASAIALVEPRSCVGDRGSAPAFLLMVLVTAIAVILSIRRDSPFIVICLWKLCHSLTGSSPVSLHLPALLNAGLAALPKKWPILTTSACLHGFL